MAERISRKLTQQIMISQVIEEIAEALGVAIAVNAGAAMVYSARVMDAVAAHAAP
jgi:hypothetical protein